MDPLSLRELQARFWQAIAGAPGEVQAAPELVELIPPSAHLDPTERLAIYADMYWHRILDVLRQDFARTVEALGEAVFEGLAREYLRSRPSRDPSIARVGEAFADFLARRLPPEAPPFAADLARLEWARVEAFDAPDAEPLRLDDLRGLPAEAWSDLRLGAVPSLTVLALAWPVHRLLDAGSHGGLEAEPTVVRVWRSGYLVFHATVDPIERAALRRLRARPRFAAIAGACESPGEAAALLARWLEDGLVVRASRPDAAAAGIGRRFAGMTRSRCVAASGACRGDR